MRYLLSPVLPILLSACGGGGSSPSPVSLANSDAAAINQGESVTVPVLANDIGVVASSLTVSSPPASGSAEVQGASIFYTSEPSFTGDISFSYQVMGNDDRTLSASVVISVNARPIAADFSTEVTENDTAEIDVTLSAEDPDGTLDGNVIVVVTNLGSVQAIGNGRVSYTPPENFTGTDTFDFQVADNSGAISNIATATITVKPITDTSLIVTPLPVPGTGYTSLNLSGFDGPVLASPAQDMVIPPNTVSFQLGMIGSNTGTGDELLIVTLATPTSPVSPLTREHLFCDSGICVASRPRLPEQSSPKGTWTFRVGTLASSLDDLAPASQQLQLAIRVGPKPDSSRPLPATLAVRPFLTTSAVDAIRFAEIITHFVSLAEANGITVTLRPTINLTNPMFVEVSSSFENAITAELISLGDPDAVNLFFIESFTEGGGRIGIAPGIPGVLGSRNPRNGVIINATVTADIPDIHARTTAEFAFHEMGHLLGLFHTTESNFTHDIIADTPECQRSHDDDNDNLPDTSECPDGLNPMFWTNALHVPKTSLSPDQKAVIYFAPIAEPGPDN